MIAKYFVCNLLCKTLIKEEMATNCLSSHDVLHSIVTVNCSQDFFDSTPIHQRSYGTHKIHQCVEAPEHQDNISNRAVFRHLVFDF